jgi:hypothetical protein
VVTTAPPATAHPDDGETVISGELAGSPSTEVQQAGYHLQRQPVVL